MAHVWKSLYKRTVTFTDTNLKLLHQLGPFSRSDSLEKPQIPGFCHETNLSSNNVSFYRVRLECVLGRKKNPAEGIPSSTTAEALAKRLEACKKS